MQGMQREVKALSHAPCLTFFVFLSLEYAEFLLLVLVSHSSNSHVSCMMSPIINSSAQDSIRSHPCQPTPHHCRIWRALRRRTHLSGCLTVACFASNRRRENRRGNPRGTHLQQGSLVERAKSQGKRGRRPVYVRLACWCVSESSPHVSTRDLSRVNLPHRSRARAVLDRV